MQALIQTLYLQHLSEGVQVNAKDTALPVHKDDSPFVPVCRIFSFTNIKHNLTRKVRGMKTLGIIGLVIVALVGFWMWKYPSGTWRYKMTLTVQTPEGVKTGSAVREVHMQTSPKILPDAGTSYLTVRGEAVVVDLGNQGTLFALLQSDKTVDYGYYVLLDSFPAPKSVDSSVGVVRYYNSLKTGKAELAGNNLPMLVRFKDINDPKTVERVDPSNLTAAFGEGVKLIGATIEITDEPVTTGVEKRLGWLGEHYDLKFDGQRYETINAENRFANSLASGAFSAGLGVRK